MPEDLPSHPIYSMALCLGTEVLLGSRFVKCNSQIQFCLFMRHILKVSRRPLPRASAITVRAGFNPSPCFIWRHVIARPRF
jgi:hypothetical protein